MSDAEKPKKKAQKKKPGSSFKKVSAFLILLLALGAGGAGAAYQWLDTYFSKQSILEEDKIVEIPSGSGVSRIAALLTQEGVIENPTAFRIALRFYKLDTSLKAGEFLFPAKSTPQDVAAILKAGKTVLHRLTLAEGLTSVEILSQINGASALDEIVLITPPEGSMLPETYSFPKGMKRSQLIAQMQAAQQQVLDELWANRAPDLPLKTKDEAIILASIVEKETGVGAERAKVAGVFVNRLKKRMRLQTDPTVIYGITLGQEPLGRPLSRKDLKTPTPYNTYTIYGLPPTPISNPGRASIAAVLQPQKTDALYFVADGTGGHAFAKTLKQHNRNVAKWRRIERQRK